MRIILICLLLMVAIPANAQGLTRIYHNGTPAGTDKARVAALNPMQMASVGGKQLWTMTAGGGEQSYSKYSIISGRTNVSEYLQSGRASARGITGVANSAIDSGIFFNR